VKALPHNTNPCIQVPLYHPGPATCFATFRLAGSLPAHIERDLLENQHACREILARLAGGIPQNGVCADEELTCLEEFDRQLMKHRTGPEWLGQTSLAALVADELKRKDGEEYDLFAYCIMPNHVHCVIDTGRFHGEEQFAPRSISAVKRHTAHEANAVLGRTGFFWDHDHLQYPVGSSDILHRILWNILSDPVRSGLCASWRDWPWSYCRPGFLLARTV